MGVVPQSRLRRLTVTSTRAEREDGRGGVVLGKLARRGARLGEERDAAQVQIVGGVGRGLADGFGNGEAAAALAGRWCSRFSLHVQLGFGDDARHHGD